MTRYQLRDTSDRVRHSIEDAERIHRVVLETALGGDRRRGLHVPNVAKLGCLWVQDASRAKEDRTGVLW